MLDVGWGDLIDYLGDDPQTRSIVIYMESIGDARSFLSAAREVALTKPIIVIKAGRTEAAAKAAASHTGSLAGRDEVLDAAFRRGGVLRVDTISDVFYMAEVLAKQPRPEGPRLTIVTNAGGPGVLAADALIGNGGQLAELSAESIAALDGFLPPHWSHGNPIDVLGDAGPDRYARALEVAADDPGTDGLLVILTPQAMTDPTADRRGPASRSPRSRASRSWPSWMGGAEVAAGEAILNQAGHPDLPLPRHRRPGLHRDGPARRQPPGPLRDPRPSRPSPTTRPRPRGPGRRDPRGRPRRGADPARRVRVEAAPRRLRPADRRDPRGRRRGGGRRGRRGDRLSRSSSSSTRGRSPTRPRSAASGSTWPTPAPSRTPTERSPRRSTAMARPGAMLGVTVQPMVRLDGYELIVGSSIDPQFGPVLLFGSGGQLVEVYRDRSLALPPLTTHPGPPDDGADPDLPGPARASGAGKPVDLGGPGAAPGPVQPAGRRAAEDQGDRHQPAARLARGAARARRPGGPPRRRRSPTTSCPGPRSGPIPTQYVAPWITKDGCAGRDPADPARGRAAAGQVPRDALRAARLAPLLPRHEARASGWPTTA